MTAIAVAAPFGAVVGAPEIPSRRREPVPTGALAGVPCAARPSTGFRHLDGPCQCFFGGPPPTFPATPNPAARA